MSLFPCFHIPTPNSCHIPPFPYPIYQRICLIPSFTPCHFPSLLHSHVSLPTLTSLPFLSPLISSFSMATFLSHSEVTYSHALFFQFFPSFLPPPTRPCPSFPLPAPVSPSSTPYGPVQPPPGTLSRHPIRTGLVRAKHQPRDDPRTIVGHQT